MVKIILISLFFTLPIIAGEKVNTCSSEKKKLIEAVEELIVSNESLKRELKDLTSTNPEIKLNDITIIVDKDGRVFTKDEIEGTLQIGALSYDVLVKLKTTVVKAKKPEWGLGLKYKAVMVWNTELDDNSDLKYSSSIGLGVEPFYYKNYNVNLVATTRLYGVALGYDITEHFNAIVGVGFLYNQKNTIFMGGGFDF